MGSIGGNIVLLGNKNNNIVAPLFWKAKTIPQVCHSAKDAETRNIVKLVDDSVYMAMCLSQLHNMDTHLGVKLFTDSIPTLESIASTKQVERKLMRNCISSLKEDLVQNRVTSFSWLESKNMIADILTKEGKVNDELSNILHKGLSNCIRF